MTTRDAKEYMNRLEIPQLFESMLTGLLYNKPEDHLQFLSDCIKSARDVPNMKWDTFLNPNKKPLPAIPKSTDGPIRSENFGSSNGPTRRTFETEPLLEMKINTKLPSIQKNRVDDDTSKSDDATKNVDAGGASSRDNGVTHSDIYHEDTVANHSVVNLEAPTAEEAKETLFKNQTIVFVLGGPGSGKGTQCVKIIEKFGYAHLSAGDLLRDEVKKDTERAKMISEIMKDGKLVPQEIILNLLRDAMLEHSNCPGFLIDGFPRELGQAKQFENKLSECDHVVFFECSEEVMEDRLMKRGKTSGRTDDNSETIKKRFETFVEKTQPVIEYYEALGKVTKIDATHQVDEIFNEVCKMFENFGEPLSNEKKEAINLKKAASDLFAHMEEHEAQKSQDEVNKIKNEQEKEVTENEKQKVVEEIVLKVDETVSLGDLESTLPEEKKLLNARVIFVIGGPGCGKGTQCAKIVDTYNYTHLSTGDLLRSEVMSGSKLGLELSVIMESGGLVPMKTVLDILREAMMKQFNSTGFLLDGFPRELEQAIAFENEIAACECVLYFECSAETMTSRLLKRADSSGRVDDNENTIKKRLETFFKQTLPLVEHFEKKGNIHKIEAEGDQEEIFSKVKEILDNLPTHE